MHKKMVLQRCSLKQLFQNFPMHYGNFLKNEIANKRENQSAADVVADVQITGNSTKQRFLLLSYVQISKLFKT